MMSDPVTTALDTAMSAVDELERRCCEPGRSPRLAELAAKIAEVREAARPDSNGRPEATIALLEAAGAMVGALQVGCCATNRLPLYATLLEQLNIVQREVAPMH